ncbi:amidohydrolase family protein [Sphingomonas lutea]|uniref:Amidohydrolase family protein n=1 Tax=Sphingomonas lutea TaxID=1045317 RepID=A0A7G9SGY8_9SPHN|nr:amidohydrolase family protein [Sphingomonas lutea]QNN67113.1 amidohydrolase family protein [Sphingomonas lutea]
MSRTIYHISMAVSVACACAAPAVSHDGHEKGVAVVDAAVPSGGKLSVIAFTHAAVVPMDRERVLRDQTVVVVNGKIAALGPASKVKVPAKAVRIDAKDRFLLPALSDMHVHVEGPSWNKLLSPEALAASKNISFENFLFPYVANGVTTVQVLSGTQELLPVREQIAKGDLLAPRLILARMIDGPDKAWPPPLADWVKTAAEARNATRKAKADGYDKMKVYSFLTKETYDAIMATAREQQMDVVGHIPYALSVEYVVDGGQKMIAHTEEVAKHAGGDYSAERISYFAGRIANKKVWLTPTLVTTRRILEEFSDPNGLFARPEAAYAAHPMQKEIWSFISNMYKGIPPDARTKLRDDFEKFQRPFTKVFHDKGGQLMTGTDALMPRLVSGFALHQELQELVSVGLTPYEALRTSTTIPSDYLGEAKDAGTIEVGKRTDLLLVDANPLEDISAASKIAGVMMRGRWIGRDEIDRRMRHVSAQVGDRTK